MIKDIKIDSKQWEVFKKRFEASQKNRQSRIVLALSAAAEHPITRAKDHYLMGIALKVQSNRLRSSVTKTPSVGAVKSGNNLSVQIGTNVFYGRAWEEGFKLPPRVIWPVNKKALKFEIAGKVIHSKWAYQPARNEKPRKWLEPSIVDTTEDMIKLLTKAGVVFEGYEK